MSYQRSASGLASYLTLPNSLSIDWNLCFWQDIGKSSRMKFQHGMAEDTKLASGSIDLVSACLIFHEIPANGSKAILEEAFRVLRPGGALAIMVQTLHYDALSTILSVSWHEVAYQPYSRNESTSLTVWDQGMS